MRSSPPASISSEDAIDICSMCAGNPRTLMSSHSGTITVAVSLQEPVVFLPGLTNTSSSSYREQDGHNLSREGDPGLEVGSPDDMTDLVGSPSPRAPATGAAATGPAAGSAAGSAAPGPALGSDITPAILRGSILLKLTKPTKIKSLGLSFYGNCETLWSQNLMRQNEDPILSHASPEFQDEFVLGSHQWEFLPGQNAPTQAEAAAASSSGVPITAVSTDLYGADAARFKGDEDRSIKVKDPNSVIIQHHGPGQTVFHSNNLVPLFTSNPSTWSRPSGGIVKPAHIGGHLDSVLYPAGEYVYNFTLAIDPRVPESVDVANGNVKYFLAPKVVRAGAFSMNLCDQYQVQLVRSPPNSGDSLSNNPVAISRNWDRRLHYEIMLPRKYISLGTVVPLSVKLTPLEKVMVHRVRVYVHETVEYRHSTDGTLNYTDRSFKKLLYEKKAASTPVDSEPTSSNNEADGAGPAATNTTSSPPRSLHFPLRPSFSHSSRKSPEAEKPRKVREKLTGNLLQFVTYTDNPLQDSAGAPAATSSVSTGATASGAAGSDSAVTTFECQLPFTGPTSPADRDYLHPDSNSFSQIRIRHRLTVSLRISKKDPEDAKRRHFEVKIDTPIVFLSPHCQTESVDLPSYDYHYESMAPLTMITTNDSGVSDEQWDPDQVPRYDGIPFEGAPPDYGEIVNEEDRRRHLSTSGESGPSNEPSTVAI